MRNLLLILILFIFVTVQNLHAQDTDNDGIPDVEECANVSGAALSTTGPELIVNGDFENGYANWTSDFNRGVNNNTGTGGNCAAQGWVAVSACASVNGSCGSYYSYNGSTFDGSVLITDALGTGANVLSSTSCNSTVSSCLAEVLADHTSGTGLSVYIDPSDIVNLAYWQQTISVQAATDYEFSAWIMVIEEDPNLEFRINGVSITGGINLDRLTGGSNGTDQWQEVATTWNSGSVSGNVVIELVNLTAGCAGNDIRLDDVSFRRILVVCDSDNDGIENYLDLDSDNDGILDSDECPQGTSSGLTGPITSFTTNISSTNPASSGVSHTLNSITYSGTTYSDLIVPDGFESSYSLTNNGGPRFTQNGVSAVFDYTSPTYDQDIIQAYQSRNLNAYQSLDNNNFSDGDYYELTYNTPILATAGGFVAITERNGNNRQVVQALDIDGNIIGTTITVELAHYVDLGHNVYYNTSSTQNSFMALYPTEDLAAVGTLIYGLRISFSTTNTNDGPDSKVFFFGNNSLVSCDYDGDGIANFLDPDSDNDGCPDALEGGANFNYSDISNGALTGSVDSDGVPTVANGGQSLGESQNASAATACSTENCTNNVDDDGDGLIDCLDPDCGSVSITNTTVGSCIDHPYADVTTLSVTVSWLSGSPNEEIEVTINNKTEYIDIPGGATSPVTVSFVVPADGSTNNSITSNFRGYTCQATATYNAPAACSNDELACSVLYICGDSKESDADAFDHGLMQYIDGINGSAILDGALAKNDASGLGLYDPNSTSTLLNIDINTYNIILVSSTTWGDISADLKAELKETPANILLLSQDILVDLAMSSNQNYAYQTNAYSDNTTSVELYNFNTYNPHYSELVGWGNYHTTTADAYLWKNAWDFSSNQQGVFFHYESTDVLGGVSSTHGARTFLGYMMDGVYWDDDTNMGAMPVPQADWFDPIRHLTQAGKLYLDQAIQKVATGCAIEDCTNGVDDDGDGLIDCDDSDCKIDTPGTINSN